MIEKENRQLEAQRKYLVIIYIAFTPFWQDDKLRLLTMNRILDTPKYISKKPRLAPAPPYSGLATVNPQGASGVDIGYSILSPRSTVSLEYSGLNSAVTHTNYSRQPTPLAPATSRGGHSDASAALAKMELDLRDAKAQLAVATAKAILCERKNRKLEEENAVLKEKEASGRGYVLGKHLRDDDDATVPTKEEIRGLKKQKRELLREIEDLKIAKNEAEEDSAEAKRGSA